MTRVFNVAGFPGVFIDEIQDLFDGAVDAVFGSSAGDDAEANKVDPRPALLAIDVEHFEDEVIARADVPGVSAEDVEIEAADDLVTIFVKAKEVAENPVKPGFSRYERSVPQARKRAFRIRRDFDSAAIKAELVDGVLTVTVPLKEIPKPVTVKVSTTSSTK